MLGSSPAPAQSKPVDTAFLDRAAEVVKAYVEAFRDLTAEETTTVDAIAPQGLVQERTTIVSTLVIYRSQRDERTFAEYRLVDSVNGRKVKDRDDRAISFWDRLAESHSVQEELQKLSAEGNRYQPYLRTAGYTLFQAPALRADCRNGFAFQETGHETINGRNTRVFSYVERTPCPVFQYSLDLPAGLDGGRKLHAGRLWLEADSARVLKEERDLYVELPNKPGHVVHVLHFVLEYAPSAFDVVVPTRILMEVVRHGGQGPAPPVQRVTQRYGPFSRFEVKVEQKVVLPTDK